MTRNGLGDRPEDERTSRAPSPSHDLRSAPPRGAHPAPLRGAMPAPLRGDEEEPPETPDAPDPDGPDIPEPLGPDGREPDNNRTLNAPINELESRLFDQRKVLIFGPINDKVARDVTGRLLALAGASDKPIDVYVNSPGGHVESGDTIHDMIRFVDSVAPVRMIGTGWVASAGALIYVAGRKERRFCLPNTRFLLHQPMGGVRGPAVDIDIEAREIIKMRERLNRLFARETGKTYEKVAKDTDRNYWLGADEAIEYGLVARVIDTMSELRTL